MDAQEWVLFVTGLVVLAPFRVLIFLVTIPVATGLVLLSVIGCDVDEPLPASRARIQAYIVYATARILLSCFGIYTVDTVGKLAPASKARVAVVGPHSTPFDALLAAAFMDAPSFVAKADLTETFVGPVLKAMQTILVDRENISSRHLAAEAILQRADRTGTWRRRLAVYPEGTCTNRTSLIQFRRGAFEPLAPVQPAVLQWNVGAFDPAWTVGSPRRSLIVLRCLARLQLHVTVQFLPIMEPLKNEDAAAFCDRVRSAMADALGVPTTEYTYPDLFLAKIAAKRKVKPAIVLPWPFVDVQRAFPDVPGIFEITRALLLRYLAAPGVQANDGRMDHSAFKAVAAKAARDAGIKGEPPTWDQVARETHTDKTVSFTDFLQAHLECLVSKPTSTSS
ncbi:Lysophosphatidylcholine acyltransferase [Hondaea fermentalgiana]|uniref:Lysophosphatidylcholine acyltransferase n=1 Tax=Hondaea fermentalgiana TaxID=2315210 RepID=A0A2R5H327_9STRA|nr:Lysophosphatidylcholine acyltransferase [Hondaea fermentalgiana]|eukprot:GBG34814.1 Lysophosphatidylcholine acyltransferase [Hondaea fermentalgiana]